MKVKASVNYLKVVLTVLFVIILMILTSGTVVNAYTPTRYPDKTLNLGEIRDVNIYSYKYVGKSFSWTSSDPDIVTILDVVESNNGRKSSASLLAITPGDVTISVSVDGKLEKSFWIRAKQPTLNVTNTIMYVGETIKLSQTGLNDAVWEVLGNRSCVSVTRLSNSTVEVKALKEGGTTIRAYSKLVPWPDASVECFINVRKVPTSTNTLIATINGKKVKFYQRYAGSTFSGERNLYYVSYYSNGYIQYVMETKFIKSEMKEGSYNSTTRPHDYFILTSYNAKTHKPQYRYHAKGKDVYGTQYPKGSYTYKINYVTSDRGNITFNLNMKGCNKATNGKSLKVIDGKLDYTVGKIHTTVQKKRSKQDITIQYGSSGSSSGGSGNNSSTGNQSKKCNYCNGSGKCHVCHGAGGEYSTFLGNLSWHDCSICKRSGICSHCHGSGYKN